MTLRELLVPALLVLLTAGCTSLGSEVVHIVVFNDTGRGVVDVAIRVDDELVMYGAAVTAPREPDYSFTVPVRLSRGTHRVMVARGELRKEIVFQLEGPSTIEIRLRAEEITVEFIHPNRLYL